MALSDLIIGAESGGNPNAVNPNSSASGLGQFINSTWLSMVRQHRPDLADGKSDQDILALRSDPALSREMVDAYASDNGAILQKNGLPVTPGNTYLAHFAGPQGAVKVLSADPNAPVSAVLGDAVVKANPFLANMTAGGLQAWAARKMGGQTPQPAPAAPQATVQAAPLPILPQGQAPVFPAQPSATQASQAPDFLSQMPAELQPVPIRYAPRPQIHLAALRAALGNRGLFFGNR